MFVGDGGPPPSVGVSEDPALPFLVGEPLTPGPFWPCLVSCSPISLSQSSVTPLPLVLKFVLQDVEHRQDGKFILLLRAAQPAVDPGVERGQKIRPSFLKNGHFSSIFRPFFVYFSSIFLMKVFIDCARKFFFCKGPPYPVWQPGWGCWLETKLQLPGLFIPCLGQSFTTHFPTRDILKFETKSRIFEFWLEGKTWGCRVSAREKYSAYFDF